MSAEIDVLRREVAAGCRVLAQQGLAGGVLGHISARLSEDELLVRCRGQHERGLAATDANDIKRVGTDGVFLDDQAGWVAPKELPIHTELMRSRPEIGAVVHAHPRSALVYGLADLIARPVFGAYNIPAMRMARDGIPVYQRPVLITRAELAREMAAAMGSSRLCLLRGHGIVTVGTTLRSAVVAAVNLETVCSVAVELRKLGAEPAPLSEADLAELPDLGSEFDDELAWRALVHQLAPEA